MYALEARRVDEDFEHRPGFGQRGNLRRIEFEREEGRRRPSPSARQKLVRVVARMSARICRSTRSSFRFCTRSSEALISLIISASASPVARRGVEAQLEEFDQLARDGGVVGERGSMNLSGSGNPICRIYFE